MVANMKRAKQLVKHAKVNYSGLKRDAESRVVRWEWATFKRYSFEPGHFEIEKVKKGKVLKSEPKPPVSGTHGYGFDAEGRVVVERQQTEFTGRQYETFYRHEADGIERFHFTYSPNKEWINVGWLARGSHGIASIHAVYKRGSWLETSYSYDSSGRVCGCERTGTNPPYGDVHDFRDIEYDLVGKIVRVWRRFPDGRRSLDFERPEKKQ